MKNTTASQVMIIDNDETVRESLSIFFEQSARKILIFKSGMEGLNSLKYQDIHVVISDYFLPDMNGLSFLEKAAGLCPDITRVLMSTIVTDELRAEVEAAGINALMEKPVSVASIEQILCEAAGSSCSTQLKSERKNDRQINPEP